MKYPVKDKVVMVRLNADQHKKLERLAGKWQVKLGTALRELLDNFKEKGRVA